MLPGKSGMAAKPSDSNMYSAKDQLRNTRDRVKKYKDSIQDNYDGLASDLSVKSANFLGKLFSKKVIDMPMKMKLSNIDTQKHVFVDYLYNNIDDQKFKSFILVLKETESDCPAHGMWAKVLSERCHSSLEMARFQSQRSTDSEGDSGGYSRQESMQHLVVDSIPEAVKPDDLEMDPDRGPEASVLPNDPLGSGNLDSYDHPYKDVSGDESDSSLQCSAEEIDDRSPSPQLSTRTFQGGDDDSLAGKSGLDIPGSHSQLLGGSKLYASMVKKPTSPKLQPKSPNSLGLPLRSQLSTRPPCTAGETQASLTMACEECYRSSQRRFISRCDNPASAHNKVLQVELQQSMSSHMGSIFVPVRPKPLNSGVAYELCSRSKKCSNSCHRAHSSTELQFWNGSVQAKGELCIDCCWTAISKCRHSKSGQVTVILFKDYLKIVHIRVPRNASSMIDKKYFFQHSLEDCNRRVSDCNFPHDSIEERLWNSWMKLNGSLTGTYGSLTQVKFYEQLQLLKVPNAMVQSTHRSTHRSVYVAKPESDEKYLSQKLSAANYRNKMTTLIDCEQKAHEELLSRYDGRFCLMTYNCRYPITPKWNDWYACIGMEQILADKLRQAATHVEIVHKNRYFQASLVQQQMFTIRGKPLLVIGFDDLTNRMPPKYSNPSILKGDLKIKHEMEIEAKFVLKYSYFRNLCVAVQYLPDAIIQKVMLQFNDQLHQDHSCRPCQIDCDRNLPDHFRIDHDFQIPACEKLLSCPPTLPFLLTGPFGTGKTRVLATSAFHVLQTQPNSRVLIATHHRRTADEYRTKYFTKEIVEGHLKGVEVIRITAFNSQRTIDGAKSLRQLKDSDLRQYRLIVTTFITSSQMIDPGEFTHIFIDEGAQAREPECVAAFRFASSNTKIVIAGDHKQVGPQTSVLGKKARDNGLAVSLLERLHSLYNEEGAPEGLLKMFQAELLTNYRCHSAILHLPSALFYKSTVKPRAQDLPHYDWQFPLHFVCTSVDQEPHCKWSDPMKLRAGVETEVSAVMGLVQQCIDNWPSNEWGPKDPSSVCVMTPSRLAEREWKRTVRRSGSEDLAKVTHTVAYDIQGLEYRAVFLCTSEPVSEDFTPYDPVKSLCDPRVFNTIVTRSQSLVVAVGNPYRLVHLEKEMYGQKLLKGKNRKCWLSYLRHCWESNSFTLSEELNQTSRRDGSTEELTHFLEHVERLKISQLKEVRSQVSRGTCSIEQKYLKSSRDSSTGPLANAFCGWKYGQDPYLLIKCENHSSSCEVVDCQLQEVSHDLCIARPHDPLRTDYRLEGIENRRCAFNGALVQIASVDNNCFVASISRQGSAKPLWCTIDPKAPERFLPVNTKSIPLNVVASPDSSEANVGSSSLSIYCFELSSILEKQGSRISRSVPVKCAAGLLFLVQPVWWNVKDMLPCGIALDVCPKGSSLNLANYIIHECYEDASSHVDVCSMQLKKSAAEPLAIQRSSVEDAEAIGVVSSDGASSCAFTVKRGPGHICLKVHIVNVADAFTITVPPAQFRDNVEQSANISIDQNDLAEARKLSFTSNSCHKAITASLKITGPFTLFDRDFLLSSDSENCLKVEWGGFASSTISLRYFFDASDLQDILESLHSAASRVEVKQPDEDLNLFDQLAILSVVAKSLKFQYPDGCLVSREFDAKDCPHVEAIMSVLFHHVNSQVSAFLAKSAFGSIVSRGSPQSGMGSGLSRGLPSLSHDPSGSCYATFTSPFRKATDILIQDGVVAMVKKSEWAVTGGMLQRLLRPSCVANDPALHMDMFESALLARESGLIVAAHASESRDGFVECSYSYSEQSQASPSRVDLEQILGTKTHTALFVCASDDGTFPDLDKLKQYLPDSKSFGFQKQASVLSKLPWPSKRDLKNASFVTIQLALSDLIQHGIDLWLSCDSSTYVLSVQAQCANLAPDVLVCLQHMQNPIAAFSQGTVELGPKLSYSSMRQYVRFWKDAVSSLSAQQFVREPEGSLVYLGVILCFSDFVVPAHVLSKADVLYVPVGVIQASMRMPVVRANLDCDLSIQRGDLVCARYRYAPEGEDPMTAVLHLVVKDVQVVASNAEVQVVFESTGLQPTVSPKWKSLLEQNKHPCQLEVLSLHHLLRVPYAVLCDWKMRQKDDSSSLAESIALGYPLLAKHFNPEFEPQKEYVDRAAVVEDFPSLNPILERLSEEEARVLARSLSTSLQLVQVSAGGKPERFATALACTLAARKKRMFPERSLGEKQKCVVLCVPDEQAGMELTERLKEMCEGIGQNQPSVLRISSPREERPLCSSLYSHKNIFRDPQSESPVPVREPKPDTLHFFVHEKSSVAAKLKKKEGNIEKACAKDELVSFDEYLKYSELYSKAETEILGNFRFDIIVCTASEVSRPRVVDSFEPVCVVLYNASMISEPQSFSAIHQALQVVLIGDHQQHRPLITNGVSDHSGLQLSMFKRLYSLIERKYSANMEEFRFFSVLKEQSHSSNWQVQSIRDLLSKLFYKDSLNTTYRCDVSESTPSDQGLKQLWPQGPEGSPIVLCDIYRQSGRKMKSVHSSAHGVDETEAAKIMDIVKRAAKLASNKDTSIAIVSYTTRQKYMLEVKMTQSGLKPNSLSFITVDDDDCWRNGTMYDLVVVSTATTELGLQYTKTVNSEFTAATALLRRESLGHMRPDSGHLCRSLSQSRQGLVVIGSVELLRLCGGAWRELIEELNGRQLIVTGDSFPRQQSHQQRSTLPRSYSNTGSPSTPANRSGRRGLWQESPLSSLKSPRSSVTSSLTKPSTAPSVSNLSLSPRANPPSSLMKLGTSSVTKLILKVSSPTSAPTYLATSSLSKPFPSSVANLPLSSHTSPPASSIKPLVSSVTKPPRGCTLTSTPTSSGTKPPPPSLVTTPPVPFGQQTQRIEVTNELSTSEPSMQSVASQNIDKPMNDQTVSRTLSSSTDAALAMEPFGPGIWEDDISGIPRDSDGDWTEVKRSKTKWSDLPSPSIDKNRGVSLIWGDGIGAKTRYELPSDHSTSGKKNSK